MGKFNIHRYMNLFGKLGISHSVLYDKDSNTDIHKIVNNFLQSTKNKNTKAICYFNSDIEGFLKVNKPERDDLKPLKILLNIKNSKISKERISDLRKFFDKLC